MQSLEVRIKALADRLDQGGMLTAEERATAVQMLRVVVDLIVVVASLHPRPSKVGDRVRFARRVGDESDFDEAPPLGWEGVIGEMDESELPLRVVGQPWSDRGPSAWWFIPAALDLVAAA